jgi:hypothetical protein
MAIDNRFDNEALEGATSFQTGEIITSTQSHPTNNSKAHQEAICQDTYREVDQSSPTDKYTRPPEGNLPRHALRS